MSNASQTTKSVGLNKPVYWRAIASASSETMKHLRAASEREQPGHCVQLRLYETAL